jgi:hypothetical protein
MHAGSSGSSYGCNKMSKGNSNNKWQGLVSTKNRSARMIRNIQRRAYGNNRNVVFNMNQGAGAAGVSGAVNVGDDEILELLHKIYKALGKGSPSKTDIEKYVPQLSGEKELHDEYSIFIRDWTKIKIPMNEILIFIVSMQILGGPKNANFSLKGHPLGKLVPNAVKILYS